MDYAAEYTLTEKVYPHGSPYVEAMTTSGWLIGRFNRDVNVGRAFLPNSMRSVRIEGYAAWLQAVADYR